MAALIVGTAAAVQYGHQGLTLSHYDARAHLMVARRITDNLTPGWKQIGAVWLPLPHLINLLPVQSDWAYRTGYPSAALSVLELAGGLAALAAWLWRRTQTWTAVWLAPALVLLNPNVLYLQSTPMTEPLLLGLAFGALLAMDAWAAEPTPSRRTIAGLLIAALALTRYEGWCIGGALVVLGAWLARRHGWRTALAPAGFFTGAIAAFLVLGWGATGRWFVTSGFFVPQNVALGDPVWALGEVAYGTFQLGGPALVLAGAAGLVTVLIAARRTPAAVLPLALLAAAALPAYAFFEGHPFRVRYMVALVAASGLLATLAVVRLPAGRWRSLAALALLALTVVERPPLDGSAAMVVEAQWETPYRLEREAVTRYLVAAHDGTPILASMGSLGHYMQEASAAGFPLTTFLHEGNGDLWREASVAPERFVRWMLIEERAEGGDRFAQRARADPTFLAAFARVAAGGGMALYRRIEARDGDRTGRPPSP